MEIRDFFPVWDQLTNEQWSLIEDNAMTRKISKGETIHNGDMDCTGLLLVKSGQLRAFILSEEGREVTIYRLFDLDICLFSASCMMSSIQFEVTISAEKDSEIFIIPPEIYKKVMNTSAPLANYTNEIMASRFSEVMWLIEQIMWKNMDSRLADFLISESDIEGSNTLKITHENIASHLGTHREVITRMLKYFQSEKIVKLSRGTIEIIDKDSLYDIQG